jgi:hypothetical protein
LAHLIGRIDDDFAGEGIAVRRGQLGYSYSGDSQDDDVGSRQRVTNRSDLRRGA